MAKEQDTQIIPFPFPPYISTYIGHKLDTHPVLTNDGSILRPFTLTRRTFLGKLVIRSLKIAEGPDEKPEDYTFFLRLSNFSTNKQDELIQDSRSSWVRFSDDDIKNIHELFQDIFERNLREHVIGYIKGVKSENPTKQRGIIEKAIFEFCTLNGVIFTNKNLATWKKQLQRKKITHKNHVISVL